jgi:hypothetical protein
MSTCYEFALECELRRDVSPEVVDTLRYMTRSQEYRFSNPQIPYPLFQDSATSYQWKTILANFPREGEQNLPGEFGSIFADSKLIIRHLSRDDEFYPICWFLLPWLASISVTSGFIGYYRGDFDEYPTLIQFEQGRANVYELLPTKFLPTEPETVQASALTLDLATMTEVVQQELIRQTENPKMSLEEYIASIVAIKDAMNLALQVGLPEHLQSWPD